MQWTQTHAASHRYTLNSSLVIQTDLSSTGSTLCVCPSVYTTKHLIQSSDCQIQTLADRQIQTSDCLIQVSVDCHPNIGWLSDPNIGWLTAAVIEKSGIVCKHDESEEAETVIMSRRQLTRLVSLLTYSSSVFCLWLLPLSSSVILCHPLSSSSTFRRYQVLQI